ncbi:RING/FYVE/PHD zinc finger superfamily protein [Actinidia rufa]|uniref:RING/FYVE/PHD zinc finger superfamily protein n=1 Tax=Actinidia rufa TaxID=165716 RepID=A0A7J0DW31_9ERIC|nr:RING/FYVE/PHD zinc finger superfamily protein [Actinidia rufa]
MLIQSSLPGSIEGPSSFVSDHGKGDWLSGAETWQKYHNWERNHLDGFEEFVPMIKGKRNIDDLCPLNVTVLVVVLRYQLSVLCLRILNLLLCTGEGSYRATRFLFFHPRHQQTQVLSLKVKSLELLQYPLLNAAERSLFRSQNPVMGCLVGGEPVSKEAPKSDTNRVLDFCCISDSYSSSKSNVEPGSASLRTEGDDTGECSSSGALLVESLLDDPSEKDICISILRSQGLLEGIFPNRIHSSANGPGTNSDNSCIWTCKVCDHTETTLKMLICDQCEEAFHLSCCNPRMKKITVDEWFCHSCLKKKHKIPKENSTSKARDTSSEENRCRNATCEGELGPIASMLIDTEPYYNGVRIGQDFQAEVPDWRGPTFDEVDSIGELLEIGPSESVSLHGRNSNKPSRLSSIGNWLQCREVIEGVGEGVDGTICGKWRRAPLFEVQTDDWECFCAVIWDPARADCSVPQLRPRLAAKKRKLDLPKNGSSQDLAEDARNM